MTYLTWPPDLTGLLTVALVLGVVAAVAAFWASGKRRSRR